MAKWHLPKADNVSKIFLKVVQDNFLAKITVIALAIIFH